MALARFRFEYELGPAPPAEGRRRASGETPPNKKWFLFHDLAPIQAEVVSLFEAEELGIERGVPGHDGLRLIFATSTDRVVVRPWEPARRHPDVDAAGMEAIERRETSLAVRYPRGATWLHIPGDSV